MITVHQSIGEAKEQFYFERTVFLRCVANSNPPVHYTWRRGREALTQGSDSGVEIYEPFFTQVRKHSGWGGLVLFCHVLYSGMDDGCPAQRIKISAGSDPQVLPAGRCVDLIQSKGKSANQAARYWAV